MNGKTMTANEWIHDLIIKNPDVMPEIIIDNIKAWLNKKGKKLSECTREELENAEIV